MARASVQFQRDAIAWRMRSLAEKQARLAHWREVAGQDAWRPDDRRPRHHGQSGLVVELTDREARVSAAVLRRSKEQP